jgi:hypothetical protein
VITFTSEITVDLVNVTGDDEMLARAALVSTLAEISRDDLPSEKVEKLEEPPWMLRQ